MMSLDLITISFFASTLRAGGGSLQSCWDVAAHTACAHVSLQLHCDHCHQGNTLSPAKISGKYEDLGCRDRKSHIKRALVVMQSMQVEVPMPHFTID